MTQEQMLRAAASLRAEARAKEFQHTSTSPGDMRVGSVLLEMSATMQADKFWADLAIPLDSARAAIEEGTEDGRARAASLLQGLHDQLDELKDGKAELFTTEKDILEQLLPLLEPGSSPAVTLETMLTCAKYTRSSGSTSARGTQLKKAGDEILKSLRTDPWEFREVVNQVEVTVSIRVPPETRKEDVSVRIQPKALHVAVKGHDRQPYVLQGQLAGPIDVDGSGWHLDGSGDDRRLLIDLEKQMGGIMWHQLLMVSS